MAKLLISPEANRDLLEIKRYITEDLGNSIAAQNVVSKIIKQVSTLSDFPKIGTLLSSTINIETGYRFLLCGNYTAFYRYLNDTVFIDRVIYGRRDYMRVLFGEISENQDEK